MKKSSWVLSTMVAIVMVLCVGKASAENWIFWSCTVDSGWKCDNSTWKISGKFSSKTSCKEEEKSTCKSFLDGILCNKTMDGICRSFINSAGHSTCWKCLPENRDPKMEVNSFNLDESGMPIEADPDETGAPEFECVNRGEACVPGVQECCAPYKCKGASSMTCQ